MPRRKFITGLSPSRTVTRYDADSPEADIDWPIDEMSPEIPERDGADASAGHDTFVAHHQWGRKETPAKRIRTPRHNTNVSKLGNVWMRWFKKPPPATRGGRAGIIQASSSRPQMARVNADGSQGVAEQRILASSSHSERSKTYQVKICVQAKEGLAWSSDQAQVQTSGSRFPST